MDSNEQEKDQSKVEQILLNEVKRVLNYYNWEQSKKYSLKEKENSEKEKTLYAINTKFIEDWKLKIKYEDLIKEIKKYEEEKNKEKLENIINDFFKKNIKDFDLNSLGEIKNISLLKDSDKFKKDEKIYINPLLNEEKMELVNKEVFESFKDFKLDVTIEVDCNLKEGKYILKNNNNLDDKKEKIDEENEKNKQTKANEVLQEKDIETQNSNKNKVEDDQKNENKNIDIKQSNYKNENENKEKK